MAMEHSEDAGPPQVWIDHEYKQTQTSINEAKARMEEVKKSQDKYKDGKKKRTQIVSDASSFVRAMLGPARQAVVLLDGLSNAFPPCKIASNALAIAVDLESDRRDNDSRIVSLYPTIASVLLVLGQLKPAFRNEQGMLHQLEVEAEKLRGTIDEFCKFCNAYYQDRDSKSGSGSAKQALKVNLLHLLHAGSNKDRLQEFCGRFDAHKSSLTLIMTSQSAHLGASTRDDISRLQKDLKPVIDLARLISGLLDSDEETAVSFLRANGGERRVQSDNRLLNMFAAKFSVTLTAEMHTSIKQTMEGVIEENQTLFELKYNLAFKKLERKFQITGDILMKELQDGPYQIIADADLRETWKDANQKASNIKRRQFIDAIIYHFNKKFKQFQVQEHVAHKDSWTLQILKQVHCHSAIADAIDTDASGYIDVEEVNEFLELKPKDWTIPEWLAYWAYGWDADNYKYGGVIHKNVKALLVLKEKEGLNKPHIASYLEACGEQMKAISKSVHKPVELDDVVMAKIDKLRTQWTATVEKDTKVVLQKINYKFKSEADLQSIFPSDRVEITFMPIMSLLVSYHQYMFSKQKVDETFTNDAIYSITILFVVMVYRAKELRNIWRRQKMDLDAQYDFYSNGLFDGIYKMFKEEFDKNTFDEEDDNSDDEDWSGTATEQAEEEAAPPTPAPQAPPPQQHYQPQQTRGMSTGQPQPAYNQSAGNGTRGFNGGASHHPDNEEPEEHAYHPQQQHQQYEANEEEPEEEPAEEHDEEEQRGYGGGTRSYEDRSEDEGTGGYGGGRGEGSDNGEPNDEEQGGEEGGYSGGNYDDEDPDGVADYDDD